MTASCSSLIKPYIPPTDSPKIVCPQVDLDAVPTLDELPDGLPETLTPWIVGTIADYGVARQKQANLVECINKFNSQK